jgi:hypothetical protein
VRGGNESNLEANVALDNLYCSRNGDSKIKENGMGGACNTQIEMRSPYKMLGL